MAESPPECETEGPQKTSDNIASVVTEVQAMEKKLCLAELEAKVYREANSAMWSTLRETAKYEGNDCRKLAVAEFVAVAIKKYEDELPF